MADSETQDWVAACVEFSNYLDALGTTLTRQYVCSIRELTAVEDERLPAPAGRVTHAYAVEPTGSAMSPLLVKRFSDSEDVPFVAFAFGLRARRYIPDSYAELDDLAFMDLMNEAEAVVSAAVSGCREFCRPHVPSNWLESLPTEGTGPLMEEGCETAHFGWSSIGRNKGEPFEQRWLPWQRRH